MRGKPKNITPFRKLCEKLRQRLYQDCGYGPDENRMFFPMAFTYALLWDFRTTQPLGSGEWRRFDWNIVERYQHESRLRRGTPPHNWVEIGLKLLVENDWIVTNYRSIGMKYRPGKILWPYWMELEELERVYDPFAINSQNSNFALTKRIEYLEKIVARLCQTTGIKWD